MYTLFFTQLSRPRQRLFSSYSLSSSSFKSTVSNRLPAKKKNSFIYQKDPIFSLSLTVADTKVNNSVYSISLKMAKKMEIIEDDKNRFSSPTRKSSLTIECPISANAYICSPKRSPILEYSDLTVYNPIYFSSLTTAIASAYNSNSHESSPLSPARVMVYHG
jgi:hypothetical protein